MGQAHHRDAGAREAPAAGGGEVGAVPVAESSAGMSPAPPAGGTSQSFSLILSPFLTAGWNCCYKSRTKSRMVL